MPRLDQNEIFFQDIESRAKNETYKNAYLQRLQVETKTQTLYNAELLSKALLEGMFAFIIANKDFIIQKLGRITNGERIILNKTLAKEYKDNKIPPRTIDIAKTEDGVLKVYALVGSKDAAGKKDKRRKFSGATKVVSPRVLLNPKDEHERLLPTVKERVAEKSKERFDEDKAISAKISGNSATVIPTFYLGKARSDSEAEDEYDDAGFKKGAIIGKYSVSSAAGLGPLSLLVGKSKLEVLNKDTIFRNGKATEEQVIERLIKDILESIHKIHQAGYIHNDVKNDNVLLFIDDEGLLRCKAIDFDLSKKADELLSNEKMRDFTKTLYEEVAEERRNAVFFDVVEDKTEITEDPMKKYADQPVCTAKYAAPEIVRFYNVMSKLNLPVYYGSLTQDLVYNSATMFGGQLYNRSPDAATETLETIGEIDVKPEFKHDMFSVGVTLFVLITGHYPNNLTSMEDKKAFSLNNTALKFMSLDIAYRKFPLLTKYKLLIDGLFEYDGTRRLTSSQAIEIYKKINAQKADKVIQPEAKSRQIIREQMSFDDVKAFWENGGKPKLAQAKTKVPGGLTPGKIPGTPKPRNGGLKA